MNRPALGFLVATAMVVGLPSSAIGQSRNAGKGPPVSFMLAGNITIEDGSPLPEPAYIERICAGRVSRDGRSDFKGYFTISITAARQFQYGSAEGDAQTGDGSGIGVVGNMRMRVPQTPSTFAGELAGCELRASLAGFRSSSIGIPVSDLASTAGAVNVGTIVLQRIGEAQGTTVSATSLNAPKDAKKEYDKGHHAADNNKPQEAQQHLEKAVKLYPHYAAAWQDLGSLYVQQNQLEKARDAFAQANVADAMFVPAYVGLSSVAVRASKWREAADLSARAAQLDSLDFPVVFYYNAVANFRLGNLEQAEMSARKAETLGAQRTFPQVSLLLGVMLADRQEYAEAAEQLRAYLKTAPGAPNAAAVQQWLAQLEKAAAPVKADATPPAK